jgi:hypothetical protein
VIEPERVTVCVSGVSAEDPPTWIV